MRARYVHAHDLEYVGDGHENFGRGLSRAATGNLAGATNRAVEAIRPPTDCRVRRRRHDVRPEPHPPEEAYMLHSKNPTRPLPNTAHQARPNIAVAAKGIDAPSLILIAVICCLCLLASLWAAVSGWDLSSNWL
jgi:hypothetical protein